MRSVSGFSVRPAVEGDVFCLAELDALCKREGSAGWSEKGYLGEFQNPHSRILVMTDDDTDEKITGFLIYHVISNTCEVLNLVVHPEHRRTGVGEVLVRAMVRRERSLGITQARLEVRKSNLKAIQFYQSQGFNTCQIRKQFYSNGEDAYTMLMEFDPPRDTKLS